MITLKHISIVIPVGPEEKALQALLENLRPIEKEAELIVVRGTSRPKQLNEGARKATRDFLWFLHADSRLTPNTLAALLESLNKNPHALHYFNLRFLKDGPPLMFINEIGCWIRSQLMWLPFGDQGFCLSKPDFERLGGFPEDVSYGEDHVFVWRARQNGMKLKPTGARLETSARKYRELGWFHITKLYCRLWTRQARPEREKLMRIQSGQTTAVAVFVKTPGVTPLKTRLAAAIGRESSLEFYELCLNTLQKTLSHVQQTRPHLIYPFWAVAEKQGLSDQRWNAFSRISQGDGDLGERLHSVYSDLRSIHAQVILIGADSPQLSPELILKTHDLLKNKNRFVIGPARDGGFYLFGGAKALPKEVWTSVTYSQPSTCEELVKKIKNHGEIVFLPTLSDTDLHEDLPFLMQELQNINHPAQENLLDWIKRHLRIVPLRA